MRGQTTNSRRFGRAGWLFMMLLGVGLIVVLYTIKTRAMQSKALVKKLEHSLSQEQAAVQILTAEIAYLKSPERLRKLAHEHLALEPVAAEQTLSLEQAVETLPKKLAEKAGGAQ